MIIAHKIRLKLNTKQRTYCEKAAGTARFAWNWALAEWNKRYLEGEKITEGNLRKHLNSIKTEQFPWMSDVTKVAPQQAIKNLGMAYQRYFKKISNKPKFKKKGVNERFRADNGPDTFIVSGKTLRLPKIGIIKMTETLRFDGRPLSVVVSKRNNHWYASISVEIPDPIRENQTIGGVDMGINYMAITSDGRKYDNPKPLKIHLGKLRKLDKAISRKKKGSSNRKKAAFKRARLYERISNIRKDALHKTTTDIARSNDLVGMETLNISGMMKNRCLSRAVSDVGLYEFVRQLSYKTNVFRVDRWYPSSKTCNECGCIVDKLPLSVREWQCGGCGVVHDRDINAAINLRNMAASYAVSVCGGKGSGSFGSETNFGEAEIIHHLCDKR